MSSYTFGQRLLNLVSTAYIKSGFYLFNAVVLLFLSDAFRRGSMSEMLGIGGILSAVIAALSALCYAAVAVITDPQNRRVFVAAGHRFLHCFLYLIFAFGFSVAMVHLQTGGLFGLANAWVKMPLLIILGLYLTISFMKAGRSFTLGFHMIRETLDRHFPLKDEDLYDDIERPEP